MIRVALIFVASVSIGLSAEPKSRDTMFRLRAKVQEVVTLTNRSAEIFPVDGNPRFVVTMDVVSVAPLNGAITNGAVKFAVHSPSLTFGVTEPGGKTFDLLVRGHWVNGKWKFSNLERAR